jgi:hypothetical protein
MIQCAAPVQEVQTVNSQQAKEILLPYRPGDADSCDPQMAEALALAQSDPDLSLWFERHCAAQSALRAGLRGIPVPDGLREQILSEVPAQVSLHRRHRQVRATVGLALFTLVLGLGVLVWHPHQDQTFASFRGRMLKTALRGYRMGLETNNLGAIRSYLASANGHGDADLPAGLVKRVGATEPTGCALLTWQGRPVSMFCFGRGGKTDLWLFVIDRASMPHAPENTVPTVQRVSGTVAAAHWSRGGKFYFLAGLGDESVLARFF